jgi:hypothetical protein
MISPSAQTGKFVINLCSVAVPTTIPQPRSAELMRYRFFLHTCWEEGTRKHRLCMGYFSTREEADKWLGTLRRIYPGAFVGLSPEIQTLSSSQVLSLLDQPAAREQSVSPGSGAGSSAAAHPRTERHRSGPTLEDTIAALKVDTLENLNTDDDPLNTTGVRHLRIEVQQEPRARREKRSGSRKP